jgi:hypothetical protein
VTGRRFSFSVNMALAPLHWTPEVWQMRRFTNPSRANSLWLGMVWNVILLPNRLWHEFGAIAITGRVDLALLHLLIAIPGSFATFLWWGLIGKARAVRLPLDVVINAEFMDEQRCARQIILGHHELVRANP